jgi:hypothetical protein
MSGLSYRLEREMFIPVTPLDKSYSEDADRFIDDQRVRDLQIVLLEF